MSSDMHTLNAQNHATVLARAGFEIISTGGGCTAWCRTFPNGRYVLLTDEDIGTTFKTDTDSAVVGVYDAESQPIGECWEGSLSNAGSALRDACARALADGLRTLNQEEVVDEAINALALSIQKALGVKTGDNAGLFFTGQNDQTVRALLRQYIQYEISSIVV